MFDGDLSSFFTDDFLHLWLKQWPQINPIRNVKADIITSTHVTDISAVLSIWVVVAAVVLESDAPVCWRDSECIKIHCFLKYYFFMAWSRNITLLPLVQSLMFALSDVLKQQPTMFNFLHLHLVRASGTVWAWSKHCSCTDPSWHFYGKGLSSL